MLRNEAIAAYLTRYHAELLEKVISIMGAVTSDARQLERNNAHLLGGSLPRRITTSSANYPLPTLQNE